MTLDATRRGFLGGLLGLTVVAVLPNVPKIVDRLGSTEPLVDPFAIQAPQGLTYQWVRTALLGVPDPENVVLRLRNGWQFVEPLAHPSASTSTLNETIETGGLVLMWRSTSDVEAQRIKEYEGGLARLSARAGFDARDALTSAHQDFEDSSYGEDDET